MPPIRREERRRKYHEALLNMLYPPPPSPPQENDEEQVSDKFLEGFNWDGIPDNHHEESGSSSSGDDELESGPQTLTRAKRKRLRKKKLKETALQRRKMIGPLLPSTSNEGGGSGSDFLENEPSSVRHNVTEGPNAAIEEPGCTNSSKLKHRRTAKRQAKEKANSSNRDKSDQDCQRCGKDGNCRQNQDG